MYFQTQSLEAIFLLFLYSAIEKENDTSTERNVREMTSCSINQNQYCIYAKFQQHIHMQIVNIKQHPFSTQSSINSVFI